MTDDRMDQECIPESLADEITRQKLAKARKRTRIRLAKKLGVTKETIHRSQKRVDLYFSILRQYVERRGGILRLQATFANQPPVILSGLAGDEGRKKAEDNGKKAAKRKAKTRRGS